MASQEKDRGIISSIFLTYFVLILHALLAVLLGVVIVFFKGVVEYMGWILLGGFVLLGGSGYLFYRRMKRNNRNLRDVLDDPVFRDRAVEVRFLGGAASLRLGQPGQNGERPLSVMGNDAPLQLESPEVSRVRSLERLAHLRETEMITQEEYLQLKKDLLQEGRPARVERDILL